MRQRREIPLKRTNPSGRVVWVARYTGLDGRRHSAGTYPRKHEAQAAIDAAYDTPVTGKGRLLGDYASTWTARHPRSNRTNATNRARLRAVLEVELEGRALKLWPFEQLRRRHAVELVDHMLRTQRRAHTGAQNILRSLSAMAEDAITDEVVDVNWVRGVRVRANDPRITGKLRPARVFSFEDLRSFARQGRSYEAMLRVFTDCGLRLGEVGRTTTGRRYTCAGQLMPAGSPLAISRRRSTSGPCPSHRRQLNSSTRCRPASILRCFFQRRPA
jgi:hypothetical protein